MRVTNREKNVLKIVVLETPSEKIVINQKWFILTPTKKTDSNRCLKNRETTSTSSSQNAFSFGWGFRTIQISFGFRNYFCAKIKIWTSCFSNTIVERERERETEHPRHGIEKLKERKRRYSQVNMTVILYY